MSQQQLARTTIELDKKNTAIVRNAKLLTNDLRVNIRVNNPQNNTKGKAWLIDQYEITDEWTNSTVYQEDSQGNHVTMETIHHSEQSIHKLWDRKKKIDKDFHLQNLPMYIMMVVMAALLWFMVKRIAIDKQVIILEDNDWVIIILSIIILIVTNVLVMLYARTRYFFHSRFQSFRLEDNEEYLIRIEGRIRAIPATRYYGRFIDIDNTPDTKLFGYSPSEIEAGISDENGIPFIHKINKLESQKFKLNKKLADKHSHVKEKQMIYQTSKIKLLNHDGSEDNIDTENIKAIQSKYDTAKAEYDKMKEDIQPRIEKFEAEIQETLQKYFIELEKITDRNLSDIRKQEILKSDDTISTLKSIIARDANTKFRQSNIIGGLYEESTKASEQFNERVIDHVSKDQQTSYEIIQSHNQSVRSNGTSPNGQTDGVNFTGELDLNSIVKPVVYVIAFISALYISIGVVNQLINMTEGMEPGQTTMIFIVSIVILFIVYLILNKLYNAGRKWTNHADQTVMVN